MSTESKDYIMVEAADGKGKKRSGKKAEGKKRPTSDGEVKAPKEESESSEKPTFQVPYMQNRELSWLAFNKRVLDQGADPDVPLLERLNFISIFWSNLQEFFMIRVGSLTDLAFVKKPIIDSKSGMSPSEQLTAIYKRCHELYPYYEQCYKALNRELAEYGIQNIKTKNLSDEQREYLEVYFDTNIMPFLSPQIINARHPFPHLENGALYIVVRLDEQAAKEAKKKKGDKGSKGAKNVGADGVTLGIIPLPRQCERIIQLPDKGCRFLLLEHVIEMFVPKVFSMYKVKHTNVICVTRNADLDAVEGVEEQGEDYREHIKRILKKRTRLAPVRLESERELSETVKRVLLERLNLKNHQTFVTSVPLDMSYVFDIPSRVDPQVRMELTPKPFSPQWPSTLTRSRSIIEQVTEKEVLLSYPYETMDAFVQLLREAAADPSVISIKITLYRLARQSHLAEALIAAAEAGKDVTALFELRARFDESNNIEWSQRFEQAGCHVLYGFKDYKVHSKICCITRQIDSGLQFITQLGTGNYNEKTAKLYTDFSFITTDPAIGLNASEFFRNMHLENVSDEYDTLWVAPLQIKQNIMAGIDEQIRNVREGKPAGLFFKTNSITDRDIINKIAEASQAGVQCTLLVRGISCIVPGIEGYTDNVCVVSIVGRLLEHSRIYCFGPFDGDVRIYLSSADLMTRNMEKRIEIAWPIKNEELKKEIIGYIGTCMADTAKLRDLLPDKHYTALGFYGTEDALGDKKLFDSQNYLIEEAQRKLLEVAEEVASGSIDDISAVRDIAQDEMEMSRLGEEISEFEEVRNDFIDKLEDSDTNLKDAQVEDFAKRVILPEGFGKLPRLVESDDVHFEDISLEELETLPAVDEVEDAMDEAESEDEAISVSEVTETEAEPAWDSAPSQGADAFEVQEELKEEIVEAFGGGEESAPIAIEPEATPEGAPAEFIPPASDEESVSHPTFSMQEPFNGSVEGEAAEDAEDREDAEILEDVQSEEHDEELVESSIQEATAEPPIEDLPAPEGAPVMEYVPEAMVQEMPVETEAVPSADQVLFAEGYQEVIAPAEDAVEYGVQDGIQATETEGSQWTRWDGGSEAAVGTVQETTMADMETPYGQQPMQDPYGQSYPQMVQPYEQPYTQPYPQEYAQGYMQAYGQEQASFPQPFEQPAPMEVPQEGPSYGEASMVEVQEVNGMAGTPMDRTMEGQPVMTYPYDGAPMTEMPVMPPDVTVPEEKPSFFQRIFGKK